MAIKGLAENSGHIGKHIITVATEHHAVLDTIDWLNRKGYELSILPVDGNGILDIEHLRNTIRNDTIMVIVMWANNETGVVQDIKEIRLLCHQAGVPLVCDATQAAGKIDIDLVKIPVGMLNPFDGEGLQRLAAAGVTGFALEAAPRTTRAQSMDVLSSQANIAGYKAVMIAADKYQRFFPMLMTAAGTVKAARVVILGVGVAGLQAIATAKRLGAVIEASDVRPSVKEQVESLGAKFIEVSYDTPEEKEAAVGVGGYAKPMPQSWLDRQK